MIKDIAALDKNPSNQLALSGRTDIVALNFANAVPFILGFHRDLEFLLDYPI